MVNIVKWALRIPILHTEHTTMNIFLYDKIGFQLKTKIQKYLCYRGTYDNYCLAWIIDIQKVPPKELPLSEFLLTSCFNLLSISCPFLFLVSVFILSHILTFRTNISLGFYYLYLKNIYIHSATENYLIHWYKNSLLINPVHKHPVPFLVIFR